MAASKYAVLSGRRLARASDQDLYDFAIRYAQAHAIGVPTGVQGTAGAGPNAAPSFATPARLELGLQSTGGATARRKALVQSLARRTTEASRQRALNRVLAGYGLTV